MNLDGMIKYLPLALFLFGFRVLLAQEVQLSPSAEVSILTLGPDHNNLYSSFWHSAIRVSDPEYAIDWVYDYGRFDFDNPNFYTDFARGYLRYKIGIAGYSRFREVYIYFNRTIEEQVLDLNSAQKQAVYEYLQENVKPENQYYFYDYYLNNCATKIRDVFVEILGDSLQFDFSDVSSRYSFRDLTHHCTTYKPWGEYGIDLALGSPIDRVVPPYDYMFLPEYIRISFENATLRDSLGNPRPAVKKYQVVHQAVHEDIPVAFLTPPRLFWTLCGIVVVFTVFQIRQSTINYWVDRIIFTITGLLGIVLACIWLFTDHQAAAQNYNLLWAFPFHVFAIALLRKSGFQGIRKVYFGLYAVLLILLLVLWNLVPQDLHEFNIPLVLLLLVRSLYIYFHTKSLSRERSVVKPVG
jgi:hypothetical protein